MIKNGRPLKTRKIINIQKMITTQVMRTTTTPWTHFLSTYLIVVLLVHQFNLSLDNRKHVVRGLRVGLIMVFKNTVNNLEKINVNVYVS